jgi:thioredoxin reductase (NADPH)
VSSDIASHTTSDAPGVVERVVIVGSGPSGYTAALYTARAELAPLVIEGAIDGGGALMKTTEVENFPGFPEGIMGPTLMENIRAQAERFGARFITDDAVSLDLTSDPKVIRLEDGTTYFAEAVIIATGSAYRYLGVDREQELLGRGVSACATCDGFFFKERDIAVVGGGDTAMEEATFLTRFATSVTVIHRRDSLRASKIMQERAEKDPKITFAWNSEVTEIHGEGSLSGVTLRDTVTGESRRLDVTGLFVAIGHDPRSDLVKGQIDLDPDGYVLVQQPSTSTNLDGVFAAGDVVDHVYRQAITAAGSGCAAALDAERWLAARGEAETVLPPEL